ncbi:MAG: hypothetical protein KKG99_16055 [Bacteroidetes bacterium]|nr:hypothetical protein [Bacteroidota bacterium]
MKNFKLKIILIILILGLSKNLYCQHEDNHLINGVKYYAMLDGYCAMAALQMNLDYYGFIVDQSLLLNLGWNYGFMYLKTPYYSISYPDTDPVEEIIFACDKIGFNATVLVHKSIKEAKETLLNYISQDIPVIIQWIPHTVLAYGYKDSANIIVYNDPGNIRNQLIEDIDRTPFGKGEKVLMAISDWEKMPYLWGMRQYQMVIVESKDKNININWKEIWKRNAEKTLGLIKNTYPAYYGIDGISKMIKDLKISINQDISKSIEIVKNYEMCFSLGTGFRRNAASFLSGQASILNNDNLRLASLEFLKSAHYFRQGYNLINWFKKNYDQAKGDQALNEFLEILDNIVECERNGANYLLEASK